MYRTFFVDDEPLLLESLMSSEVFLECGYASIGHYATPHGAAKTIMERHPDVVFAGLTMPGLSSVDLKGELLGAGYDGEFVIISAFGEFEEARQFFKMDGFDHLIKPITDRDLQTFLDKLSRRLDKKKAGAVGPENTPSPELNKITKYMCAKVGEKHSPESIGKRFDLNANYVCSLFSRFLGVTFVSYLTSIRMKKAAFLIRTTKKAVKEISTLCGYQDYFHFCRVFRDVYAYTPTEYREAAL